MGNDRENPDKHKTAAAGRLADQPGPHPGTAVCSIAERVEEPVAHDGVDLDFAAFCSAAAGLVSNECSGWCGWRERAQGELDWTISSCVSGRAMASPGCHQPGRCKRDTTRKLMVVEDVLLKSTFAELLPAGASARPPPLVWWPTETNRQGDGGPLGPHVVEQGGIQINRGGRAPADQALHRQAMEKHFAGTKYLFESVKASVRGNSQFSTHCQGDAHRAGSETKVPASDVVF